MSNDYVITIARAYGSGGRTIGKMLADELNIEYYDKNMLQMASDDSGIHLRYFHKADETIKPRLFKKDGHVYKDELIAPSSSEFVSDDNLFNYQAKIIKEIADKEPCVIVGRCADYVLRERKNVIRVFVYAGKEACIKNVVDMYGITEKEASKIIEQTDKIRSAYYKYYTGREWDNARNYDVSLDSSNLGFEKCVSIIKSYIAIKNR